MDPARGFISLARSFDESDIFQNEKWLKVFLWCLIQANHKDKNVPVTTGRSKTVVKVKRGQFIFGRNKAADRLNMSPSTVRNIMEKLQVLESISIKKDNHYSIVTICKYDEYQSVEFFKGQPTDNQRTTNGQPTDTTNTPNNDNNDNKKDYSEEIKEIISFLNLTCNTKYRSETEKTKTLLKKRLSEKYTVENFKTVILKKFNQWVNTADEMYLRPETLFGNKFEGYLNQRVIQTKQPDNNYDPNLWDPSLELKVN